MLNSLLNQTLIVTTILSSPYCMRKLGRVTNATGNDQFEGYAVDLIHEIAQILGFQYKFRLVADGHHGALNRKTMQWDGLIRELLDKRADLAIADLTISHERRQAVDFSMPFMNLGISLLYRKPTKQPPSMFSFMSPLSPEVWLCVAAAYLAVSALLFALIRFTPQESEKPINFNEPSDVLEKQPTLTNCLWFAMGPLAMQGCELLPRATSTRMVAGMWWFFALIIISSYTANLAAFLTVESMDSPIKSVEDLARQTKVKYGSYGGGSTVSFFRDASSATYQRMWSFMESTRPSVFTANNSEGVERVARGKGNYAFLMESVSIQYVIERDCELTQVGGQLDSKGYGIAMPQNSSYQAAVSSALLKLQEEGILHVLKTRWWKQKRGGGMCTDGSKSSSANELGLANVGGVFLVFLAGVVVALLVALIETRTKQARLHVAPLVLPSPTKTALWPTQSHIQQPRYAPFYYTP